MRGLAIHLQKVWRLSNPSRLAGSEAAHGTDRKDGLQPDVAQRVSIGVW
jgi:hypothetical protein